MAFVMPKIDFKNPKVRNVLLIVALAVTMVVLWYQYIFAERQQSLQQLQTQREARQNQLNSILAMKPQLERLRKEIVSDRQTLDSLKSIFPDQKEIPKLIREITKVAATSGIATKKFTPQPDVVKEYYIENRYAMSVTGGYHQLANFFAFFANLPLIINLSGVSITANPAAAAAAKKENGEYNSAVPTVSVNFEMTTFSSKR
jgi:type IV pilus assembly protein PilO